MKDPSTDPSFAEIFADPGRNLVRAWRKNADMLDDFHAKGDPYAATAAGVFRDCASDLEASLPYIEARGAVKPLPPVSPVSIVTSHKSGKVLAYPGSPPRSPGQAPAPTWRERLGAAWRRAVERITDSFDK